MKSTKNAVVTVPIVGWHLTQINLATNTNKFYDVFLADDGTVAIQWGRIGSVGQCKVEFLDYDHAADIALRQVHTKAAKGYKKVVEEFKFTIEDRLLQQSVEYQGVQAIQQAFAVAQRDGKYTGATEAVFQHYDSFVDDAQALMDRAATLDVGEVMDEWAQIQASWTELDAKHATAATTLDLTRQMVTSKLMGG